jgi:hypothetical protein
MQRGSYLVLASAFGGGGGGYRALSLKYSAEVYFRTHKVYLGSDLSFVSSPKVKAIGCTVYDGVEVFIFHRLR